MVQQNLFLIFWKKIARGIGDIPSYSPENLYVDPVSGNALRNTMAAAIDIEIIHDVFDACLSAEKILSESCWII